MVYKKITTKKTNTGYSINVFMQEGRHVRPLVSLFNQYFQKVYDLEHPESTEQTLLKAEKEISALEKAKVLH